jgi:tRNA-Thr(GGU) m(6)t(6)A37 methyltransferase TsaA
MKIEFTSIGIIHTPFKEPDDMPIQPVGARDVKGTVTVFEDYRPGLQDLDGFSHIILLYFFHRSRGCQLKVVPFMDSAQHGIFATRAPRRPNPLGLSIVQLDRVSKGVLHIRNVDMLDNTPLLDIKPYVPQFDGQTDVVRSGWFEKITKTAAQQKADDRFT